MSDDADKSAKERTDKLQSIFDQMQDHVSLIWAHTDDPPDIEDAARAKKVVAVFSFSMKGFGFGELTFVTDENGQTYLDTERTSRGQVKEMLGWLVDHAILDWEKDPEKHLKYNEVLRRTCGHGCKVCNPPTDEEKVQS